MTRHTLPPILAAICIASAMPAVETGLGVAITPGNEGEASVSVPLRFDGWFLEPYAQYDHSRSDRANYGTLKERSTIVGIGAFKIAKQLERADVYYGVRLGYGRNTIQLDEGPHGTADSNARLYEIAPTLGFEICVFDRLYICGEAGLQLEWISSSSRDADHTSIPEESAQSQRTVTKVMLRYFL